MAQYIYNSPTYVQSDLKTMNIKAGKQSSQMMIYPIGLLTPTIILVLQW